MPTGEDAHGSDYFTPVFLLPQLCNSTSDLDAARSFGLRTAYVERPGEYGPQPKHESSNPKDLFHARDLNDLATQLGC